MRALLLALSFAVAVPLAEAQSVTFLAFGDSVTVGHGDGDIRCPDNTAVGGYPPRLTERLALQGLSASIANHGVCGETTAAGLTRIDTVLDGGGDAIIIMEGTNDVSMGISLETTLFNLNELGRKAVVAGVVPLLASVVPRGPDSERDSDNAKTSALALELAADAAASGWPFADPFSALFGIDDELFDRFYQDALHPDADGYEIVAGAFVEPALAAAELESRCLLPPGSCVENESTLCLNEGRFNVRVSWEDFDGLRGVGRAVSQTSDTGAFWYFDPANLELIVKVLDGTGLNRHFWVFYGSLSNVEFILTIVDTETGECEEYRNPPGQFASVGDIEAFPAP